MTKIQPPTNNYVSQGQHGIYKAVDYGARSSRLNPVMNRREIYAVEDGTITKYGYEGAMGNRLELTSTDGKRRWGMGHLESPKVKVGTKVKRGQLIGIMGHTGQVYPKGYYGTHLHLVCRQSNGTYVYPPNLYNTKFSIYTAPKPENFIAANSDKNVRLLPKNGRWNVYHRESDKVLTVLRIPKGDKSYVYINRGVSKRKPNRMYIEAGGKKGEIALADVNMRQYTGEFQWIKK